MRARRPAARRQTARNGATAKSVDAAARLDADSDSVADTKPSPAAPRTVSVSPHKPGQGTRNNSMVTTEVILTPRVLDQRAFDELSDTLQSLISQSQDLTVELARQVESASSLDTQANRASTKLQDRLHLSARMLKALQLQIDRMQTMQDEFDTRSNEAGANHKKQLEALDAHRAKLAAQLDASAGQIADAMRRVEKESAATIEAKAVECDKRVMATEKRLAGVNDTVEKLGNLVVDSEKSITGVAHRAAQSAKRAEHVVDDAKRTLRQCEDTRQALSKDLIEAEERLNESAKRADELTATVQNAVARCEAAERQLSRIMDAAEPFVERLDRLENAVSGVNALLPLLAPWEGILLQARKEPEQLPRPLRDLVDLVRAGLRGEMRNLAGSMRGLAERVELMSTDGLAERASAPKARQDHSGEESEVRAAEIVTLPAAARSVESAGSDKPAFAATANGSLNSHP